MKRLRRLAAIGNLAAMLAAIGMSRLPADSCVGAGVIVVMSWFGASTLLSICVLVEEEDTE